MVHLNIESRVCFRFIFTASSSFSQTRCYVFNVNPRQQVLLGNVKFFIFKSVRMMQQVSEAYYTGTSTVGESQVLSLCARQILPREYYAGHVI